MSASTPSTLVSDPAGVQLDELVRSARVAWPTVDLCPEQFLAHLVKHLPGNVPVATARVSIAADLVEATTIPWELLRDPRLGPVSLLARTLVRTHRGAATSGAPASAEAAAVRILLVISRPRGGEDDVPFRSVSNRLIAGLDRVARERFDLDVLRPPTYEKLAGLLRDAADQGRPYHIVHFDGHGLYADAAALASRGRVQHSAERGHLVFEAPEQEHNATFVDGATLGRLLAETLVPVLVLNACQSAYVMASATPHASADPRSEVAGYGSLAQEVISAGTAGVIAMRYSVYAVTAAQFVAELYTGLASGLTLGEAVARGRKSLADNPDRQVAYDPRPLQDWCVPLFYERTELRL